MSFPDDDTEAEAVEAAHDQAYSAYKDLQRPESDYLHLPWTSTDALVGGIQPGTVGLVVAGSGQGKTSFLMSMSHLLLNQERTVYYLGLETTPPVLRTQLACLRLNLHPGDVLSGKLKGDPHWPEYRKALIAELEAQKYQREGNRFLVGAQPHVDREGLTAAAADAAKAKADIWIIDHVDHAAGADYAENLLTMRHILSLSLHHGLRTICASQLNQASMAMDRLAIHRAPTRTAIKGGGHKLEVAAWALGVYRPIKKGVTRDELAAVKLDQLDMASILAPNTAGVVVLKNRNYGSAEGQRCLLHHERGLVRDKTSFDEAQEKMRQRREEEHG